MEDEFYELEETRGWHSLFQHLHQISKSQAGSQSEARHPMNIPRNRYRDVLPIDATRVKLDDDYDYINANFVKAEDVKRSYILTQGPLHHTSSHFWQMIWEQNSKGILMLNKCVERSMNKCYPYWPRGLDEPIVEFEPYRIELLSTEDMHSYRLSHLRLEKTGTEEEARVILHFHYTRWPDFGVPKTADDFLEFLESVRSSGVLNEDVGPCVIHCSAGIGRSGTFCLVDVCLKKIEDTGDVNSVDVQSMLLDMRKQRLGLIQTPDQLRFSYIAILQGAMNSTEDDSDSEEIEEGEMLQPVSNGPSQGVDIYNHRFEGDGPPPLPPRPPDLLAGYTPSPSPSPPPPPPPSLPPPGPPQYEKYPNGSQIPVPDEDDIEEVLVRYHKRTSQQDPSESEEEEDNKWYLNGESNTRQEVESEDEVPPPPPPRKESTLKGSRSPDEPQYPDDHFLGVGRGGELITSLPRHSPPPLPPVRPPKDQIPRESNTLEEKALIQELTELERMVSNREIGTEEKRTEEVIKEVPTDEPSVVHPSKDLPVVQPVAPPEDPKIKEAAEIRRRARTERQSRLQAKVGDMQSNLRSQETRDSSLPWFVVGMAVLVVGYCVYYYFKT